MTIRRLIGIFVVFVSFSSPSSVAQDTTDEMRFLLGNFEFVLLHELAHVVIGDKKVPILGPLESAADYTAITMAIRGDGSASAKQFLDRALTDAATAFATTWKLAEDRGVDIPYWDSHALGIQRYYSALCLFYGSDSNLHSDLLNVLPQNRAAGCATEYHLADEGLQWLIDTYGRPEELEGAADIVFDYGRITTTTQQNARSEIRRLNLLENTVRAVDALFAIDRPFKVTMRACGRPEAAWRPEQRELLICHEMFDAFSQIYRVQRAQGENSQ